MQFANSSFPCYSTFTSDSCHTVNHLVAITFVDEETLVMLVGYSAATPPRPARQSFKRRLNEYFTITKKAPTPLGQVAPTKSLVGAFSVIVKSLHNLREPSFEALLCGVWSGQMISISVTEAAELSTTHRPHTLPQTRPQCQFNTFNMLMLTKYL